MECPHCNNVFDEIIVLTDCQGHPISGCYGCLQDRGLIKPQVATAA